MLALVIADTVVVVLLGVLVAGLLRSHADILRALHELGAGVGDPARPEPGPRPTDPVPVQMGPRLAPGRGANAFDVVGQAPDGAAVAVACTTVDGLTLLAFLSSGCASCAAFFDHLAAPGSGLPAGVRPVVVTKGPEYESPGELARRARPGTTVVMSSQAWTDYEVPGSPFFVLVDGRSGRRLGEGVANHPAQVADLVRRAVGDGGPGRPGVDGPARERENDAALAAAGIGPGHPSLYPRRLGDVFGPGAEPDGR